MNSHLQWVSLSFSADITVSCDDEAYASLNELYHHLVSRLCKLRPWWPFPPKWQTNKPICQAHAIDEGRFENNRHSVYPVRLH